MQYYNFLVILSWFVQGSKGEPGRPGAQGPIGRRGATGATGVQGFVGRSGPDVSLDSANGILVVIIRTWPDTQAIYNSLYSECCTEPFSHIKIMTSGIGGIIVLEGSSGAGCIF